MTEKEAIKELVETLAVLKIIPEIDAKSVLAKLYREQK